MGTRLANRDAIAEAEQVLELEADEVADLLARTGGPDLDEVAARWRRRTAVIASNPPSTLGPESAPPALEAFPAPLDRATAAMMASVDAMEGEPSAEAAPRGPVWAR